MTQYKLVSSLCHTVYTEVAVYQLEGLLYDSIKYMSLVL